MKLEITKEKVLEAASKCSTEKETLKTLFPECFEDDNYYNITAPNNVVYEEGDVMILVAHGYAPIGMAGKCFFLTEGCNWELKGNILTPTRKK